MDDIITNEDQENNDECESITQLDNIEKCLVDEIALEGLDGITIDTFWIRLSVALNFPLPFFTKTEEIFWKMIQSQKGLEYYTLPEGRPPIVIFNRYDHIDDELGMCQDPSEEPIDIYPYKCINDIEKGIVGSSTTYDSRVNVTEIVKNMELNEVEKLYGTKLIIVASQTLRNNVLFQGKAASDLELTPVQYCILERIGRSREHGEITQGKNSLNIINDDPKNLFYYRKVLLKHKLVTKQQHHQRIKTAHVYGSLFHLTRFYNQMKTKAFLLIEQLVALLKTLPNYRIEYEEVRMYFPTPQVMCYKKLYKSPDFQRFIRTDLLCPYREHYPDATETEWKLKGSDHEKKIRIMELIDPNVDVNAEWFAEEPEEEDELESIDTQEETRTVLNKSLVHHTMNCITKFGSNGAARNILANSIGRSLLCTRAITKLLHRKNVCFSILVDIGRQRLAKTCSRQFSNSSVAVITSAERNLESHDEWDDVYCPANVFYDLEEIDETDSEETSSESNANSQSSGEISIGSQSSEETNTHSQSSEETNTHSQSSEESNTNSQSLGETLFTFSPKGGNFSSESDDIDICSSIVRIEKDSTVVKDYYWREEDTDLDCIYSEFQMLHAKLKDAETEPLRLMGHNLLNFTLGSPKKRKINEVDDVTENLNSKKDKRISLKRKHTTTNDNEEDDESYKRSKVEETQIDVDNASDDNLEKGDKYNYKLEKFFGNSPKIYYLSKESDKVKLKVIISTAPKAKHSMPKTNVVTQRKLLRANIIKNLVHEEKIITDITKIDKVIYESEATEGYNVKIDKKSILRLIGQLITDGYVKALKVIMSNANSCKILTILCDASIELEHSIMQSALEQMTMKFAVANNRKPKPCEDSSNGNSSEMEENNDFGPSLAALESIAISDKSYNYEYDRHANREYGYVPKFVRTHLMHTFLFYLVYEFPNYSAVEDLKCSSDLEPALLKDLPPVYCGNEITWKTFIPPLPEHKGWPIGWTLVSDIILRLPVTLFAQICHISYRIPGLKEFLKHPVKKYYLVKDLPPIVMNGLLKDRKYIYHVHDSLVRLCYMGLLQFGPQKLKKKDQVFVYVNRRASLRNTMSSKPDYHQVENKSYPVIHKYFLTNEDIDNYWYELWNICMATKLGRKIIHPDKYVVIEKPQFKTILMDCLEPTEQLEAEENDNGKIPGDHLGAGGLDSALFAHIKRNWRWANTSRAAKTNPKIQPHITGIRKAYLDNIQPKMAKLSKRTRTHRRNQELGARRSQMVRRNLTSQEMSQFTLKMRVPPRMRKIVRKLVPRKDCKRRKSRNYDDIDRKSLLLKRKLRVDWSSTEDNILLLGKLATMYLYPHPRKRIFPLTLYRNVLHTLNEASANKTSRACQRRINYMLKNPYTLRSIRICAVEIKRHPVIRENFEILRNRMLRNEDVSDAKLHGAFIYMMHFLITHFPRVQEPSELSINRLRNDVEMYQTGHRKLTKILPKCLDPKTIRDIQFYVVKSTVHSALCSATSKTGWAYHFFKVYQKYPEELLRSVMTHMRKEQLVAIKKGGLKKSQEAHMPLQTTPYQLSCLYLFSLKGTINYDNLMQTCMYLLQLRMHINKPVKDITPLEVNRSNICTSIALAEMTVNDGHTFNIVIPKYILRLDPKVKENDTAYERILIKYASVIATCPDVLEDGDDSPDADDPMSNSAKKSGMQFANTGRLAFYLQGQEYDDLLDDSDSQHFHDFFVVNPATVNLKLKYVDVDNKNRGKLPDQYVVLEPKKCEELLKFITAEVYIRNNTNPEENLLQCLKENGGKEADLKSVLILINYIRDKGVMGASVQQLQEELKFERFNTLKLQVILRILRKLQIIFRFGVETCLYVHYDFHKSWVIDTFKLTRLEKEKIDIKTALNPQNKSNKVLDAFPNCKRQIRICPWINVDGTVNRRTLEIWLSGILNHCLVNPGISLLNLSKKFTYVTPFEVRLLTEYLEFLGCIRFYKLVKEKVSLFSTSSSIHTASATGLEDSKELLIETEPTALVRLSLFIGYKGYRKEHSLRRTSKKKPKTRNYY